MSIIEDYEKQIGKIKKGKAWITDDEVENLVQDLKEAKSKIRKIHDKLQDSPINKDSAHRNKDMLKEADLAKDKFFMVKGKSKPKGWKEEKAE